MDRQQFLNIAAQDTPTIIVPDRSGWVLISRDRHGDYLATRSGHPVPVYLPKDPQKRLLRTRLDCLDIRPNGVGVTVRPADRPLASPYALWNYVRSEVGRWHYALPKHGARYLGPIADDGALGTQTPWGRFVPALTFDANLHPHAPWRGDGDDEEFAQRHPWVLLFHGPDNYSSFLRFATQSHAVAAFEAMNGTIDHRLDLRFYNS